ncbi:MAG: tetratricopeptide repeat protein [Muribaculaceae bacterium]|nr:tetratricopeptide repeat protein [Muribaculaceae bacterium]MDE6347011.1 tetratricopeptide repeat protein [Muribaculaceae bacterium]
MSKKTTGEETRTSIDNLNDSLTGLGAKVQKNMKVLSIIGIVIAAIVVGVIVYIFLVKKPAVKKQDNAIGQADREMLMTGNDSISTAMYLKVADGGQDAGNRAKLMAAIGLYKQGKYDEAIGCLKGYSVKDAIIGPASLSLLGDCYVNTDKLDDAIKAYKKAISESDSNPYYTPVFMVKLAHIYHEQKKYGEEADIYQEIMTKYPQFLNNTYLNIEKDYERAKQLAGK